MFYIGNVPIMPSAIINATQILLMDRRLFQCMSMQIMKEGELFKVLVACASVSLAMEKTRLVPDFALHYRGAIGVDVGVRGHLQVGAIFRDDSRVIGHKHEIGTSSWRQLIAF
jgi:hypothetical protein